MRQFTISLILLLIAASFQFVNSENEANSEELNTDDYDDDSDDLEDSPDDQDFHFEDKKPFYKQSQKNHVKDRVKEIYLSWDLDLCKDVQCKPNQVCLIQKSRKSAICVARKSVNRKKAQSKKDAKWSNNSKKLTHKVTASINKSNNQVKAWDSSYLPSSFSSPLSSPSTPPFDKTKPWKDCRPCPVTKPAFYCGTDNSTYSSMCRLQFHNCVHETEVEVACKGFCPCGSSVNVHTRAKEVRNHERWNKYMDTLSKLRRSHKVEKFVKNRAKVTLEYSGLHHDGFDGKKSLSKKQICTREELKTMGERLSDWFAVVLRDQKRSQLNKKETFLDYITSPDCPKDIANMFHRLDTDEDLRLSLKELYDLEHDKREKCLKQYLDGCDEDRDTFLNPHEWCSCFDRKSKPCLLEKAQRKKVYDEFVPKCDKEGFYQPIQCHLHKCWCVDRFGIEIENTRQTEIPDCDHKAIAKRKDEKRNIYSQENARINDDDLDDSDDSDDSDDDSFDGSGDEP